MYLHKIELLNYRNYPSGSFEPQSQGNLIIGPNGCGKTNLLEAISYCGIGRSVRSHKDEDLLAYGAPHWTIQAEFITDSGRKLEISMAWCDGKKLLKMDGIPARQLSALFGNVKTIYFAPEDLILINGSPRFRRQYFDLAIAQLYPEYIPLLRELHHIVAQRNALLKTEFDREQKRGWDLSFIKLNRDVLSFRHKYLELLNAFTREKPGFVSQSGVRPFYEYHPVAKDLHVMDTDAQMSMLLKLESREKHWQRGLIGAHLDDYDISLEGRPMKSFASQGQKRMVAITLKLSQAALVQNVTGIRPILLFDDIFAELDSFHSARVRQLTDKGHQVFVASPRQDLISIWPELVPLKGFGGCA